MNMLQTKKHLYCAYKNNKNAKTNNIIVYHLFDIFLVSHLPYVKCIEHTSWSSKYHRWSLSSFFFIVFAVFFFSTILNSLFLYTHIPIKCVCAKTKENKLCLCKYFFVACNFKFKFKFFYSQVLNKPIKGQTYTISYCHFAKHYLHTTHTIFYSIHRRKRNFLSLFASIVPGKFEKWLILEPDVPSIKQSKS